MNLNILLWVLLFGNFASMVIGIDAGKISMAIFHSIICICIAFAIGIRWNR